MLDGYQKNVRDPAVQRAVEVGLINDSRFADVYIRSKISQGWGPLKIKTEISKKELKLRHSLDGLTLIFLTWMNLKLRILWPRENTYREK